MSRFVLNTLNGKLTGAAMALALAPLLGSSGRAHAAGFEVAEQGMIASGTGGAGTARDGDPAAGWYNPAALADGGGWRFAAGIMLAAPVIDAHAPDGSWSADGSTSAATPPHLYTSWARGADAAGVSITVPYGGGVSWPADWPGRYEIVSTQLQDFRFAPFYARRFGAFSLSAGAHVDFGRMQIHRKLDFVDTQGDVAINLSGPGYGVDASAYYHAAPTIELGLSYKSRTRLSLSGGANFTDTPAAFTGKAVDQTATTQVGLPDRIAAGGRWHDGRFAVLLDVEVNVWSTYDKLVVHFANPNTPDALQVNDWSTTVAVRAGGEWTMSRALTLRGGAFVDPSPVSGSTLSPTSPDSTRVGATLGVSYNLGGGWAADGFYEYLHLMGSTTSAMDDSMPASYGGHAQLLGAGLRWVQ